MRGFFYKKREWYKYKVQQSMFVKREALFFFLRSSSQTKDAPTLISGMSSQNAVLTLLLLISPTFVASQSETSGSGFQVWEIALSSGLGALALSVSAYALYLCMKKRNAEKALPPPSLPTPKMSTAPKRATFQAVNGGGLAFTTLAAPPVRRSASLPSEPPSSRRQAPLRNMRV